MAYIHNFAGPIIVLVGPAASGKTTLAMMLAEAPGTIRVVSSTTRKQRPGEIADYDYHFIEDFDYRTEAKERPKETLCMREFYIPDEGSVHYWIDRKEIERSPIATDRKIVVLDPRGAEELRRTYPDQVRIFYLTVPSRSEIIERLVRRGDSLSNAYSRVQSDSRDFRFYNDWNK